MEKPKSNDSSAFVTLADYQRTIAASVKQDEAGNPVPNFNAIEGVMLVMGPDGSFRYEKPSGETGK